MVSFTADSATTAAAATVDGVSLKLDSLPIVDIRLLSQSELYSLSLCCSSSFDPHRCDDVVIPKIDRSVFNESAGSRKQTYSRLRLAPPSSSPIPIRRRTPHLRTTAPIVVKINDNSDPENAENSHIITLLKELFYSDVNPDELVPVEIEYSHSPDELVPGKIDYSHSPLPAKLPSLPLSYASIVGNTSHKRKRGRPRKKELFENGLELAPVEVIDIKHNVEGFRIENETGVRENLDDRDKEFVNQDGVAVDFVDLGRVEHPFLDEIMHRTQGLKSEKELLGFLEGLDGQWGSRRKKRRIVDVKEFGSALPIGWKLLLSIKKRNGRVWLYCRRYISPSGRQFLSCKDVSSYLLALHGAQSANPAQQTGIVPDDDKLTSVAIVDHPVQDDQRKENLVSITSSSAFTLEPGNQEMQISINPGDLPEDKVRVILHCIKCNMTFSGNDELLQHQSSLHRKNRNKIGVRITDGVIIKEGKYECQFCHKTFSERHRYNGHVGTHVRYQAKIAGESEPHCQGESVDSIVLVQDNMTKGSLEPQRNNVAEICYEVTNDGMSVCSPGSKDIVRVGDSEKVKRTMSGADEPSDIVITTNSCSGTAVFGTRNENNSFCGASDHAYFTGCAAEIIDGSSLQRRSGRCSPLQFHDETRGVMNGVITNIASAENLKQDMASEISLFNLNNNVKSCDSVLRNADACQTRNEHKLSEDGIALDELVFDSCRSSGVQDKDTAVNEKQLPNFEKVSCQNTSVSHIASTSVSMVPKPIEDSTISMLAPLDGKACAEAHVPCSIGRSTVDEMLCFGSSDKDSFVADDDVLNRHKQMQYGISSVTPFNSEVSNHEPSNPGVRNTSKSVLFTLSGHENSFSAQNNYEICGRKNKVGNNQNFGISELSDTFRSSNIALNLKPVTGIEQCRNLEDCSGLSSATDTHLFSEDSMMREFSGAFDEHKQEPFEGILLGPSSVSEVFDKTYRGGSIYTAPPSWSKFSYAENTRKHELSLSFGNLETKQLTDSNKDEQERYQGKSFGIESSVQETYGLQTHITSQNSNASGAQKQGKSFGMDFLGSSFNARKQEHNSFNMGHLGRDWDGPAGTSGQNIIVDFGNDYTQTPDSVKTGSTWRAGNSNVLQSGFAASNLQDPSSKCFHTFDLTPDKGEEGLFGVNETFDILANSSRSGKTVPVEYSFMDELSSNSVPGESKIFPYVDVEQGLDPSFWLGNDNLMSNTDGGHLVTSICVWCRNVFYHEPSQTRMQQTGAIGSMCPSCSNRIPGQFSVL